MESRAGNCRVRPYTSWESNVQTCMGMGMPCFSRYAITFPAFLTGPECFMHDIALFLDPFRAEGIFTRMPMLSSPLSKIWEMKC